MKKLYFTDDFSPENVEALQSQGFILRDIRAYKAGDFVEQCDEAHGDVPDAYADKVVAVEIDISNMTVEQLKALLDDQGIDFDASAKKAELLELATAIS